MISEATKSFMKSELTAMSKSIQEKSEDRISNNPFNAFSESAQLYITKYMSLGRSFDSQLGNRLQRISMFMARERFGVDNVPSYIFITISGIEVHMYFFHSQNI